MHFVEKKQILYQIRKIMASIITKRSENYSQWYVDIVHQAGLAENSAVRGCMVIKPYGFAIWEKMQSILDKMFKDTGHQNAYFPIFIPKSFFNKEAKHVEGFAKECAVITHYRLKQNTQTGELEVDPEAKLEEELIVRPTSETIIWDAYRNWIQSYRDLPILINQWANVVRWEMRTRLFLRTAEFLWQEGHTAHATREEAIAEAIQMIDIYETFATKYLAIPVLKGVKSPNERFAGADETYCIEALMQDGRALQAGTSHFLGQNFAKAFDVKFLNQHNQLEYVWATSWGVSTRLIGAVIMTHSDDNGLVLPPKIAPIHVVVIPIFKNEEQLHQIDAYIQPVIERLRQAGLTVKYDKSDKNTPGWKFNEYELKGVPVRLAVGLRDIQNQTVEVARRDTLEKQVIGNEKCVDFVLQLINDIQENLYKRALAFREQNTHVVDTWDEFVQAIEKGGFVLAHWDGTPETEQKIKEETKATIRLIPLQGLNEEGKCILTGKTSRQRVYFARAY